MESVAEYCGLIKAALCLKHKLVPPNIHFNTPNPKLNYEEKSLMIPTEAINLPKGVKSFASVNSFGFGGTNAHAVLEEATSNSIYVKKTVPTNNLSCLIMPLSARSEDALKELAKKYSSLINTNNYSAQDLIYTTSQKRSHHHLRLGIVSDSVKKIPQLLESFTNNENQKVLFQIMLK